MNTKKNVERRRQSEKIQLGKLAKTIYSGAWQEEMALLSSKDQEHIVKDFLDFLRHKPKHKAKLNISSFTRVASSRSNKKTADTREVSSIAIINDNMPFLVDSVVNGINALGHSIDIIFHPLITVERDRNGELLSIGNESDISYKESLLYIQIDLVSDEQATKLEALLHKTLTQIRQATGDWRAMLARLDGLITAYKSNPPPLNVGELEESIHFLEWLKDNNFTFLGLAEYSYQNTKAGRIEAHRAKDGLGILSDPKVTILHRAGKSITIASDIKDIMDQPTAIIVTKANIISLIHRRAHLDYIGIKTFSRVGDLIGELLIVGLFTSTAYTRSVRRIPLIRRKVAKVLDRSSFDSSGHSGKGLVDALETYPRDELFQIDQQSLLNNAMTILHLQERPRVKVLLRHDRFDRFVAVMVYVPREIYGSRLRRAIGKYLEEAFDGRVANFTPEYMPGTLVRVYFIIGRHSSELPAFSISSIEQDIDDMAQPWHSKLVKSLVQEGYQQTNKYAKAFSAAYVNTYDLGMALYDIEVIDQLDEHNDMQVRLFTRDDQLTLRVYSHSKPIPLSARLPILEHMAFHIINESTYFIKPAKLPTIYLHELILETDAPLDIKDKGKLLERLYMAVWKGEADNDGLNVLTLRAGLYWRDITVLRAVIRYLLQAGMSYDFAFIADSIGRFPKIACLLIELFYSRLNPDLLEDQRKRRIATSNQKIDRALEKVISFDDDRIINSMQNLINAAVRTNFFQTDNRGNPQPALALKLDSAQIEELPMPRPFRETFVHGPLVEGVHLRFGTVARGGLRWSNRAQDYRTEALGLVKAQQVKNAVIVPVGAKGCFLPRQLPTDSSREKQIEAAIDAYSIFIGSLLDVTDNIKSSKIVTPANTVCHDQEDPYLVVAADKGTASFSDIANAVSDQRGFWLGDAFASGGSVGYDHKKMGITARGAWESVKRHFREMDRNIQKEPFSVVGIGDMSGDVFGNGMLLSPEIKLIAAFDHRDIFIDPEPDTRSSLAERKRLFGLGMSSWQDYNTKLLSKGGSIFSRSDKAIQLSAEIQSIFGIGKAKVAPHELITAILKVEVDLFWFGGIGTYIRSSTETNNDVGDKANDNIRIAANQLSCKVIGEGANLGLTQKARIEFNQLGGRCYSDAVDNSAGVNSSDFEVNIKIALGSAVQAKTINYEQRNKTLASMTDNIAILCLANNYRQGLAISLSHEHGKFDIDDQEQLMLDLEQRGLLHREVETLPSPVEVHERKQTGQSLTRAEIGVLLAYVKIALYDDILASSLPDDPVMQSVLFNYFPDTMQQSFKSQLKKHRLRREIIATTIGNASVNFGGVTFISRMQQQTGQSVEQIVKGYIIVNNVYGIEQMFYQADALDNKIAGACQLSIYDRLQQFLIDRVLWFLQNIDMEKPIAQIVKRFSTNVNSLPAQLIKITDKDVRQQSTDNISLWTESKVPEDFALQLAQLPLMATILPITLIAENCKYKAGDIALVYYRISGKLSLLSLIERIQKLRFDDPYDRRASDETLRTIRMAHNNMVREIVRQEARVDAAMDSWISSRHSELTRAKDTVDAIVNEPILSISKIIVVANMLSRLAETKLTCQ